MGLELTDLYFVKNFKLYRCCLCNSICCVLLMHSVAPGDNAVAEAEEVCLYLDIEPFFTGNPIFASYDREALAGDYFWNILHRYIYTDYLLCRHFQPPLFF